MYRQYLHTHRPDATWSRRHHIGLDGRSSPVSSPAPGLSVLDWMGYEAWGTLELEGGVLALGE